MDSETIDIERLKDDLQSDLIGSAFVGGYGGAFLLSDDLDNLSPEEIVQEAVSRGMNLRSYVIDD